MKNKKYFAALILAVSFALFLCTVSQAAQIIPLKSDRWDPVVRNTINDMFAMFGRASQKYNARIKPYAVFDFDNTCSILDVEEQLAIYQLEHLRFAIKPNKMYEVLITGVPDVNKDLGADYNHTTVAKIAADAARAYKKLFDKGFVSADKSKETLMDQWINTDDWKEFATKARWLYDAIDDNFDSTVAYPWITYWFTGMTPAQVKTLATESHMYYSSKAQKTEFWQKLKWKSPKNYRGSNGGQVTVGFNQGITVSPEIVELFQCLNANGFDIWINSASYLDVILAAVNNDVFGLRHVRGVVAMTNKIKDGVITNEYDYDFHDQTQGVGKSTTIDKWIRPLYRGHGPTFVAFDSQGDWNFVTEYKDTAVGLCLNRTRTDDAGICAAVAVYQNEKSIDLAKAQKMGDTRYVLQGRNENGGYFWPRPEVQRLGKSKATLLSGKAQGWLKQLEDGMSIKDVINDNSKLKGMLSKFTGYKSR
jgi:phosphoserine phosphatase